jgi:ubiquinone/menaquinone biosynthesis C-methylase UbiE
MAELNRFARFFANAAAERRSRQRLAWLRPRLHVEAAPACLEIGAGVGATAARLVEELRPSLYIATDLDPRQLDAARRHLVRRYPSGLPSALDLRPADMLHLPFDDRSFDVVFAFVSVHHASRSHRDFSNVPTALAEIDRVLRPGGRFVYEEIVHLEGIRAWLAGHGYAVEATERRWKRLRAIARRPERAAEATGATSA